MNFKHKQMKELIFHIKDINQEYSVTHFEFIQKEKNLNIINEYYKQHNIPEIDFSLFTEKDFNDLYDMLFWVDFYSILETKTKDYFSSHYIYDKYLTERDLTSLKKNVYKKAHSEYLYNYLLSDGGCIEFKILHDYGSSDFKTLLEIRDDSLFYDSNKKDHSPIVENYLEEFNFKNTTFTINKENLNQIALVFLEDINKFNLTNMDIYNHICAKAPNHTDTLSYFLSLNYTKDKIKRIFYPVGVEKHKKEDNRTFFYFNSVYLLSLSKDLSYQLPGFFFEHEENSLYISSDCDDYIELRYNLDIIENDIILFNDDIEVFKWKNIKQSPKIKEDIVHYIQSDTKRIFNREFRLYKFERELSTFFGNIPGLKITSPHRSKISFEDIINKEIFITISLGEDEFGKTFNLLKTNFHEDNELMSFKEKIKIKNEIERNNSQEPQNKKRI